MAVYDFKQLSPADFEELTRDLLQKHWSLVLESFKTGRDKGIDLRYAENKSSSIIVQCKHFSGSTVAKLLHHLRHDEYSKVARLAPDRYVLVTSLPLNPDDKDQILRVFQPYIQSTGDIFGSSDINNLLGLFPQIETQHYKLWLSSTAVLERVLNNAAHIQTDFDVKRIQKRIPLYVQTANYSQALTILNQHKIVIISGVPGIGKTTLADMLLFTHLESGYHPVVIKSSIAEGKELFNEEIAQIFYFDDFLGETFLGNRFEFLGHREDSAIINFMDLIARSKKSKLILTTREHVLRHAYHISEHFKRERTGLVDRQCILEVSDYTLLDRGRILYNHIYFSDLPQPYKNELLRDAFYLKVLKHRNFNPRLVEWLSRYVNIKALPSAGYKAEICRVLENPEQLWRIAFEQQISDASRSLLLALYSLGGEAHLSRLGKIWRQLHKYRSGKYNWKTSPHDWRQSLQDLEGGFIKLDRNTASFVNSSVKDFLDSTLTSDLDHLEDVLSAACLFEQVVNLWTLRQSDKGKILQRYFARNSQLLMTAIEQTLHNIYEEQIDLGLGSTGVRQVDVRPEVRLQTILSIAGEPNTETALEMATKYLKELINFWSVHIPNFKEAVQILRRLENTSLDSERRLNLYTILKNEILLQLNKRCDSSDLVAVVDYIGEKHQLWEFQDRESLTASFQSYLDRGFDEEFGDNYTEDELNDLSARLEVLGNWFQTDMEPYQMQIADAIAELERPEEEEPDPVRDWNRTDRVIPEHVQEIEVRRLFDGLQHEIPKP